MHPLRVLIVDDHPVFRQGVRDVLDVEDGIEVVAEAMDGGEAFEQATRHAPDIILMDINLPTINGLELTRKIIQILEGIRVIMLTAYDSADQVIHALRSGASAYCPKDIMPQDLVDVIKHVADGGYYVSGEKLNEEQVSAWLLERLGSHAKRLGTDLDEVFTPLSPREMQILRLVTQGKTNKQIAYELEISHQTVKNHMTSILRKLDVQDRTQAAIYALGQGWARTDGNSATKG